MLGELTFRTGFYFGGFYFYPRKRMDAPRREGERVSKQA